MTLQAAQRPPTATMTERRRKKGPRAGRRIAAMALTAAVVVAGCGGGGSAQDQITSTVKDFYSGFVSGDGNKACDQLTSSTQQSLLRSAKGSSCSAAISRASKVLPDSVKKQAKNVDVTNIKVNGNSATATIKGGGQSGSVQLTKQGGKWKISNFPGG